MSGGHWGGKDRDMNEHVDPHDVPTLMELLGDALHIIDYDICGDTVRDSKSEGRVYDILMDMGNYVFDREAYRKTRPLCECCQSRDLIYKDNKCYMCHSYGEKK